MTLPPNAYPAPPPFTCPPVELRALLPIYPPPEPLPRPALPSPLRRPIFPPAVAASWELSTHLLPACYLRTTRLVAAPPLPAPDLPKQERKRGLEKVREALDTLRTSKVTDGYPVVLWNCVNRYVRRGVGEGKGRGMTLAFQHANGFPKEIFEPTLAELFAGPAAALIDEVWVWESVQHGDAALVNAGSLSAVFDWHDNARDLANFLLHFLPAAPSAAPLPTHLARVPAAESARRARDGFAQRTVVAVGHSYGGCTSALAACVLPALFAALYLVDPVIIEPPSASAAANYAAAAAFARADLALGALARRSTWPSRAAALEAFQRSPFFAAWDPRVLAVYVACGLCPDEEASGTASTSNTTNALDVDATDEGTRTARTTNNCGTPNAATLWDGPVRLKTPPTQEAAVFAETHTEAEAFARLADLPPRVLLRWAMPGRPGARNLGAAGSVSALGGAGAKGGNAGAPGSVERRVWVRREGAGNAMIQGGGHLIPQEAPAELARDLGAFLLCKFGALPADAGAAAAAGVGVGADGSEGVTPRATAAAAPRANL